MFLDSKFKFLESNPKDSKFVSESNLLSLRGSAKLNCICHCEPCIARRGNPQKKQTIQQTPS